jgi:hypothetical protein
VLYSDRGYTPISSAQRRTGGAFAPTLGHTQRAARTGDRDSPTTDDPDGRPA